jgi:tetratricopeptide (TPR) repeat protein
MPNARNIPVSTLQGNIWYHLGLAYYLKNDLPNALTTYKEGLKVAKNDDSLVSKLHWYYMILRRMGKKEEAQKVLAPVNQEMDIIENMAYHKLCLFYKGEITLEEITSPGFSSIMNDAVWYGIGNWYLYNGQEEKARKVYDKIFGNKSWASFGYIAAEADYARLWHKK